MKITDYKIRPLFTTHFKGEKLRREAAGNLFRGGYEINCLNLALARHFVLRLVSLGTKQLRVTGMAFWCLC